MNVNIQKMKVATTEIFGNSEHVSLVALKFFMLDLATQNKSKFVLVMYPAAFVYRHFRFMTEAFIRSKSMWRGSIPEEAIKTLNSVHFMRHFSTKNEDQQKKSFGLETA